MLQEERTSSCPILFSPFQVSATVCQRSQATIPDRPRDSDVSSGLFQCLHVTSPSRTAKIKHVSASRTTGENHRSMLEHKKRQCLLSYFSSQSRENSGKEKKPHNCLYRLHYPRAVSLRVLLLYSENCRMLPGQGMSIKEGASLTHELKCITLTKYSKNS